jgi:hypothetical protein
MNGEHLSGSLKPKNNFIIQQTCSVVLKNIGQSLKIHEGCSVGLFGSDPVNVIGDVGDHFLYFKSTYATTALSHYNY